MTLAPWRSPLSRALHLNRALAYARYLQLATMRLDGRPANRTVVFRGFRDTTNQLQFVTDGRSDKVPQMQQQPWAEGCWYFPKTREQFRLLGRLQWVQADEPDPALATLRRSLWQHLSEAARSQFAWPHPGAARMPKEAFEQHPDPSNPLPQFWLLLLDPEWVDHLELRGDPQNRTHYQLDQGAWITQAINP